MAKMVLTESELHQMINETVKQVLIEEGWFGDKFNQVKSAANTFVNNKKSAGFSQSFQNAKKNWNTQGELNALQNLSKELQKFVDDGQVDPQMTVAQLIGGKYNNNKFGKLTGKIANRKAQISNRGGESY